MEVLKGIDQHIKQGEKVVVIGPSGSGKSTFLRCLNLLEVPTEGEILIEGESITAPKTNVNKIREKMGMVVAVNQKSVFNMSKFVGSVMMRQKSGKIINLASVAGLYGNPGQINYSATKAAIVGMTKTVAKELGSRGITCNAVAPGFIKTPMTDKLTDAQKQAMINQIAMKRYGEVDEIAGVVSFLASKDASYVTGQVIEISGGLMM